MECREVRLDLPWPPNQARAHRFVVYDVFDPPEISFDQHVIGVVGLVERPLEIPLRELAAKYPCVDVVAPFHCVTGWSVEGVVWRGCRPKFCWRRRGPSAGSPSPGGWTATAPLSRWRL